MTDAVAPREIATMPAVEARNLSQPITLVLARTNGSEAAIHLGPAEAVAVAGELIQAARARLGRLDWPQSIERRGFALSNGSQDKPADVANRARPFGHAHE